MKHFSHSLGLVALAAISVIGSACAKKTAAAAPPAPPAPVAQSRPATAAATTPQRAATASAPTPVSNGARQPNGATRARIEELLAKIEDAYFDYNAATLRSDALKTLQADATELRDILKDYPTFKLTIEGHCDERGSAEYNIGLGDRRAEVAKDYLVQVGIPVAQLGVVSYGKERPVCQDHDEACWQRNRRIHIVTMAQSR